MPTEEDVQQQKDLLATNREVLSYLLQQRTGFGLYTPPHILRDIREARDNIKRLKTILREWGVEVEDHPDDVEDNDGKSGSVPPPPPQTKEESQPVRPPPPQTKGKWAVTIVIVSVLLVAGLFRVGLAKIIGEKSLPNALAYVKRGNAFRDQGEYSRAIADYNEALKLKQDYDWAYLNRGIAYREQGSYNLAITDFSEAIQLDPNNRFAYTSRGIAYYNQEKYEEAITEYNKAIMISPDYAWAYANRALAYEALGQDDLAAQDRTKSASAYYVDRGDSYGEQEKYDEAIADYTKAIEIDPDYALAYHNRGIAYDDQGEYDLAIADYTKAIELDPNYILAYTNRALAYEAQGQHDLAAQDRAKVAELE